MAKAKKLDRRRQLGLQIKWARGQRKWRLRDLSVKTGLSAPKLCRIEGGLERIRLDELELIASALKLPVNDLTDPEVEFSTAPPRKGGPRNAKPVTKPARKGPTRKPGKVKTAEPAKVVKPKPKRKVKAKRPRAPAANDFAARAYGKQAPKEADQPMPVPSLTVDLPQPADHQAPVPPADIPPLLTADDEPDQQDLPRAEAPAVNDSDANAPLTVDADDSVKSAAS